MDTSGIGDHDGPGVFIGEVEPVTEEQGADEGQLLELFERDGGLQELPLGLQREKFVDELFGVRQKVVVVVLVSAFPVIISFFFYE